jgi:hypothetical protein
MLELIAAFDSLFWLHAASQKLAVTPAQQGINP